MVIMDFLKCTHFKYCGRAQMSHAETSVFELKKENISNYKASTVDIYIAFVDNMFSIKNFDKCDTFLFEIVTVPYSIVAIYYQACFYFMVLRLTRDTTNQETFISLVKTSYHR